MRHFKKWNTHIIMSVSISFFFRSIFIFKMPHKILHSVSAPPTTLRISSDIFNVCFYLLHTLLGWIIPSAVASFLSSHKISTSQNKNKNVNLTNFWNLWQSTYFYFLLLKYCKTSKKFEKCLLRTILVGSCNSLEFALISTNAYMLPLLRSLISYLIHNQYTISMGRL